MSKPFDTKRLEPRKNKSGPYRCKTCGDFATVEALFQVEGGGIIAMQRFCDRCLSSADYEL
ncbi:MAG: hypothetical protein ABI348_05375 [Nitrososphaera sp.]